LGKEMGEKRLVLAKPMRSFEKDLTFLKKMIKKKREQNNKVWNLMNIEVKLFANFREFLPPGFRGYSVFLDVEEGTTIGQILEMLKIPESIPMITLVNGIHQKFEDPMHANDVLSLFPPVAGG
jgi:molybdopterin converting factor small subunit